MILVETGSTPANSIVGSMTGMSAPDALRVAELSSMASVWDWLRHSRAEPYGQAAAGDEAMRVYRAALEQFEQLMRAAGTAGPAARPLPLFYALSQAGRAVIAARGGADHRTHGLTLDKPPARLLDTIIRPTKERGQFQVVAEAVASAGFTEGIELGRLIASLPETGDDIELKSDWPRALAVWLLPTRIPVPDWTRVGIALGDDVATVADVDRVLKRYPIARERFGVQTVPGLPTLPREETPIGTAPVFVIKGPAAALDIPAPQYRVVGRHWIRPAIDGDSGAPSPLMTWWAVLFTLSMLARYHPVAWVEALDVDASSVATTLERVLRKAMDAVPQLVFEALLGYPVLLRDNLSGTGEVLFD
jgi:hypothetical protein